MTYLFIDVESIQASVDHIRALITSMIVIPKLLRVRDKPLLEPGKLAGANVWVVTEVDGF